VNRKKLIVMVVIAASAVMAVLFYMKGTGAAPEIASEPEAKSDSKGAQTTVQKGTAAKKPSGLAKLRGTVQGVKLKPNGEGAEGKKEVDEDPMDSLFGNMAPKDKAIAIQVQKALDANDSSRTYSAALRAMSSQDAELRKHAIDALAWCGSRSLPHLTKMLSDPNAEVAESALNAVQNTLMGMDDAFSQFKMAAAYLMQFSENEDARTVFAGIISSASGQLVESRENRTVVVETILTLIDAGGALGEQAKELYSDITGEDWVNRSTALMWAKNSDDGEETQPEKTEEVKQTEEVQQTTIY